MNFTIAIYQKKVEQRLRWTTLGLQSLNETQSGKSSFKLQRGLIELLKQKIGDLDPAQAAQLSAIKGLKLHRVRMELTLRAERKRKHSGLFPLVLCPYAAQDAERFVIAYHPDDQTHWFPVNPEMSLSDQASAYFSKVWASFEHEQLKEMESNRKDILKTIAFSADPKSLLDELPDKPKSIWSDLEASSVKGAKRRKGMQEIPKLASDQTLRAAEESLSLGMAREEYRKQLIQLLCGEHKRPVLLVGPSGSGKTTLINRWVHDLLEADDYPAHRNLDRVHHVWALSGKRIIAGMSYLGEWEERCTRIVEDARGQKVILQIEDVHAFGRIGQSRDSERSLASFFRSPLSRGELVMVGECTPEQLQRLEDDAPSFASAFARVYVHPTRADETMQIMFHEARQLELRNDVAYSPHTLRAVLELGGALFSTSAFPGKALDLLRELARGDAEEQDEDASRRIEPSDLVSLLSSRTGLPEVLLRPEAKLSPGRLAAAFEAQIMGQPEAVRAAVDLILKIREGLTDNARPYAVYLLTGPTGVGKTELAKCIAEYLYGDPRRLLRLDMSEFSSWDAPGRLIGDRFSPEGLLTRPVRERPFSVVLLDEIEKADPSVLNLLLQLFDEGRLTDAAGKLADFTHTVVIMTSNLGAKQKPPLGFGSDAGAQLQAIDEAVRSFFPPELFNRIDRVVRFSPISQAVASRIAEKELGHLVSRRGLTERSIFVQTHSSVLEQVVREGWSETLGARPIKRYLEENLGALLAEQITRGAPARMQIMRVFHDGGDFRLLTEPLVEAEPVGGSFGVEPLLELRAKDIKAQLPKAQARLADGPAPLRELAARIGDRMRTLREGDPEGADRLYQLEVLRLRLEAFEEKIEALEALDTEDPELLEASWFTYDRKMMAPYRTTGRMRYRAFDAKTMTPTPPGRTSAELIATFAEAFFLKRAMELVERPEQHSVFVELLRVGKAKQGQRFSREDQSGSLLESLTQAYLHGPLGEGELESFALVGSDKLISGTKPEEVQLNSTTEHVVLKLVGLCLLELFKGENGAHVWQSLALGTELIRVRIWSAFGHDDHPKDILQQHQQARSRFEEAMEKGLAPPPNPDALLPAVRVLTFEPPARAGRLGKIEVEDYGLGYSQQVSANSLLDALRPMWILRKSLTPGKSPEERKGG